MDYSNRLNTDAIVIKEKLKGLKDPMADNNASLFGTTSVLADIKKLISGVFSEVRKESPVLFWIVMICFLLAVGCLSGLIIDDRTLMGISVWLKPMKFAISIAIYALTVGYLITFYPYSKRKKWFINGLTAWTLLIELGIIVYQGAMGVQSHYNMTSAFDALLFAAMGILVAINVLVMILFIFDTIRLKLKTAKSIQFAILIGWIVVLAGSWIGGQMISQMSHTVGAADGGAGLPFINWSTVAGDLRIAHFFGLHGIQIIPLFALWVYRKWEMSSRKQVIIVTIFGLLYATWIGLTFYQAKLGMALLNM